jgi:hypothetical protein
MPREGLEPAIPVVKQAKTILASDSASLSSMQPIYTYLLIITIRKDISPFTSERMQYQGWRKRFVTRNSREARTKTTACHLRSVGNARVETVNHRRSSAKCVLAARE